MAYKVIILYQLYMPSYFLGTFTEYPKIIKLGFTHFLKHYLQVFRLIPHPHYRLEPDKIKRPEKNPIFLQLSLIWRREGDSNPRYSNPYDSLANCWFQPLTHLSSMFCAELRSQK